MDADKVILDRDDVLAPKDGYLTTALTEEDKTMAASIFRDVETLAAELRQNLRDTE
jgi:hypothetical protein